MAQLASGFVQFGASGNINGGGFSVPGVYTVFSSLNIDLGRLENTNFIGETIYTFIGNGPSILDSDEALIVKHVGVTFAPNPVPGGSARLWGSVVEPVGPAQVLVGAFPGPEFDVGFGPNPSFVTVPSIPEPSRVLLSLLGPGAVLVRRRR